MSATLRFTRNAIVVELQGGAFEVLADGGGGLYALVDEGELADRRYLFVPDEA